MSWSLLVMPLNVLSRDGMADWIASAEISRGVPEQVPSALPLPSIAEVLSAFQAAGCHGTNWFTIVGEDGGSRLPLCPDPAICASTGGLDLGEVSIYSVGAKSSLPAVTAATTVETVVFRKPNPAAVLRAVCGLASLAGPQLVFDESAAAACAVWPGEHAGDVETDWPW